MTDSVRSPAPRWRLAGWCTVAVCTIAAGVGLASLRIDDDLRSLLRDGSADFAVMDEVAAIFGPRDRECLVRATARQCDVFAAGTLESLATLAEQLRQVEGVAAVRSMFDVRRQGAVGAVLPVIPRTVQPLNDARRAEARERAARHPLVAGQLLSRDANSSLLLLRLEEAYDQAPLLSAVVARLEAVIAAAADGPLTLELTGVPALREQATRALRRDMIVFNTLGLSLAVILSATVARSLRSTVVACVPPFVGAVWAMGVLGLCGAPINILTSVVPSLALVVGTCDSIHFIEDLRRSARRGINPVAASGGAVQRVGTACGLTSIVTAIGFASLALARIDAVRTFGIAAAVGALASFAAVTLLTPLLASTRYLSGVQLGRSSRKAGRLANLLAAFSVRHARPLAIVASLATLALGSVGSGLEADSRVIDSLPRTASASRALEHIDKEFGGVMGIDVVVGWPEGVDWRSAEVLAALEQAAGVLEAESRVSASVSLADVSGSLSPRARGRLDADEFTDLVSAEERLAVVRARVSDLGSRALEGIYDRIDRRLAVLADSKPGWRFQLAGMSVVSARNIRQLVRDLGSSLLLEVLVIGGILAVAFRSPLAGIVSLVPNVFPLTAIGAVLALSGRGLDPASVIVFNVCLGLAVDDTVHVLSALVRQQRPGISMANAVRRAVVETGNAVVIGGVVLSVGFAAVMASTVPTLAGFGVLACSAVAAATVAELVFLPAMLVVTDRLVSRWWPTIPDRIFGRSRRQSPPAQAGCSATSDAA